MLVINPVQLNSKAPAWTWFRFKAVATGEDGQGETSWESACVVSFVVFEEEESDVTFEEESCIVNEEAAVEDVSESRFVLWQLCNRDGRQSEQG